MRSVPSPTGNRILWISSLAVAILFSLGVRIVHLEKDFSTYHDIFFFENKIPMMTTMDAYFYLASAKRYLAGRETLELRWGSPLLVLTTAWLSRLTGLPQEEIGFFLPVFLATLMALAYYWWGLELGGSRLFLLASLLGTGSYYWYMRTCLGRLDTDSLIPFFVYGISFLAYRFTTGGEWRRRLIYLFLTFLMSVLFCLWWLPARYLILPLVLVPYGLSLWFIPAGRPERRVKAAILLAGGLLAVSLFFGLDRFLPGGEGLLAVRLTAFLELIFKAGDAADAPQGPVITELLPATWEHFTGQAAGHVGLLVAGLVGFIMIMKNHPRAAVFFLIPAILASVSFAARRFLIFLIPLYALGLGYFLIWLEGLRALQRLPRKTRLGAFIALAVFVLAVNSARAFQTTIRPGVTAYHLALAKTIDGAASANAKIWNWWDLGYFLSFYGNRDTIINGGNQTPDRMFVAAFPLTTDNPVLAGNWMRFFSARGMWGAPWRIDKLDGGFFNTAAAVPFLKDALSNPQELQMACNKHGVRYDDHLRRFLFPEAEVYLYLENDLFDKAYWWHYYGASKDPDGTGIHPSARRLSDGRFSIDQINGAVIEGYSRTPISDLYFFTLNPRPHTWSHKTYAGKSGLAVIWLKELDLAYMIDRNLHHCLFTKLLLLDPLRPPEGYTPVKYAPFQGGVWRVE